MKFRWGSEPDQTRFAPACSDMVHSGLFGLRYASAGLAFAPNLPAGWGDVTLRYRDADLTITLRGAGTTIRSVTVDGRPSRAEISAVLKGAHTVEITLPGAAGGDRDGDGAPDVRGRCTAHRRHRAPARSPCGTRTLPEGLRQLGRLGGP